MGDKEQAKKNNKGTLKKFIIFIIVFSVAIIIFSVSIWFIKKNATRENDKDPKNAPAAAKKFMNDVQIDENGNITLAKSIAEWWEELKKSGNKITTYLNSPEELAKLMTAAMALDYPDTRKNPDAPVNWDKVNINAKEIQGIVKFKRALKDGGKPISMTYVSPSKFQELVSKYNTEKDKDKREKALEEVLKHFTIEKSYGDSGTGGSPIVAEVLRYACSWVGKVPYKSWASGDGDNGERFLPLKEGRASDCSHFVHWVFEHVGLMDKDNFIHSLDWGNGGDNGGCPGTVRIGTDLSQASPGDVLWWHFGDAWNNHVAIYLGNEKMIECAAGNGVIISSIKKGSRIDQILHFSQLPTDTTGYFDPDAMTLHSSISGSNGGDIAKVPSLNGMVFIGDSIMYCLAEKDNTLKQEGAKYLYRGGSTAKYFLGKETAGGSTNNCIENNGYFNWNANFKNITNPTGFYLVLGQNFYGKDDRIEQMDELIKKIRSQYPTPPIFINSVLNTTEKGSEEQATKMNEELKVYCASQNNVYYSDILRGFKERITELADYEDGYYDHPNPQGSQLLVKNIKENIVGSTSGTSMSTQTTSPSNSVSGEMIVQEAEKYVGKLPYVWGGSSLETGADCSGFAWAILKKLGLIDWGRTNDEGFRNKGTEVSDISQAQPGDILCFNGHISIYKGNGYMVEALNKTRGVVNDRKVTDESRNVLTIRRFASGSSSGGTSTEQQTSTFKVKVATWNETEDIMDAEDPAVSDYHTHTYNITTATIPYQEIVSKYKMPFNYLWTMLVYSQDKDYVFDLAKLVDNSKIEITIHDNYTVTTNIVTDNYTNYKKVYTTANAHVNYRYTYPKTVTITDKQGKTTTTTEDEERSDSEVFQVDAMHINAPQYTNVHTTINRNNTLDIALTLADSWFVKYTKEYTYNKPTENSSPPSSENLPNIENDPLNVKDDYGGNKEELNNKAEKETIERGKEKHGNAYDANVAFMNNANTEYTTRVIKRSKTIKNIVVSSSYVSSVPGGGGISLGTSISNVKTGSLNKDNYVELPDPKSDGDENNPIQGFCLVGDDMMAYVILHYAGGEHCTLYLTDLNTMQEYDHIDGLLDHGNTIAYDPVNSEIIFPENGVIQLIKVNRSTKKFEGKRSISPPQRVNDPSSVAYNATHDLFIANSHVYTRDAFYSGGKPIKDLEYNKLEGDDLPAGSTSYGNHVYYYFADWYGYSTNYLVVCDLNTGGQVELIHDNLAAEGEEISFASDGTLYACNGVVNIPFRKTDYNYFLDPNIDKSNVTPGVSKATNDIARYNTGGDYKEKTSFEKVLNSHYNARSNILSVTEWLFKALEQNADTEKMADLTRYLLHKATGNDYGEYGNKQFNYEEYDPSGFNEIGAGGLEGNTTEERVWLALVNAGFNDVAAAGIMGNLSYESGGSGSKIIKTDTVEGGYNENNGGIGMCQWTNGGRGTEGRNTQLKKYAQSKGTTWKDEKTQIEYLITEITGEGSAKGYANVQFITKTYGGVTYPKDALKTVDNNQSKIEYATKAFAATFERPAASAFTNSMSKRVELAKYFYSQFNGKRSVSTGNGDILKACEEVMKLYLSRDAEYSIQRSGEGKLIYGNIEKCVNEARYACCATYTSSVLYKSGLLTANQINKYNYHYTGSGGIPDMLEAAGWRKVNMNEIKAGDVVVDYGEHVLIYAGGDNYYDNKTCIHGSQYGGYYQATKSVRSGFSYYRSKNVQVWRAPGK